MTHPEKMTWYATNWLRSGRGEWIEPVEVLKSSDRFITVESPRGPRRIAKQGDYRSYYPTWQEARNALLTRYSTRAEHLRRELDQANACIAELNALEQTP